MSIIDCSSIVRKTTMYRKFDICFVSLSAPEEGSYIQGGYRPAVIISNNSCNKFSPVVTVVPLTSQRKKYLPTHVNICGFGLDRSSIVLCEQLITIDRSQIGKWIGHIYDRGVQNAINHAVCTQIAV